MAEFEERRRRREALDQAAAASRDAAEALERETRDAARAVANLRDQRRRSEAARAVSAASPIASRAGPDATRFRATTKPRRSPTRRVRSHRRPHRRAPRHRPRPRTNQTGGEPAEAGVADENLARRAAAEVEATYVQPRWKQRQEERWAAEARAAVAEMEVFDAAATRGVKATSNISKTSDLFAKRRCARERHGDVTSTSRLARGIPRRGRRARRHALIAVVRPRRRGRRRRYPRGPISTPKTRPGRAVERCVEEGHFELAISSSSGPNDTACAWETSERAGRGGHERRRRIG